MIVEKPEDPYWNVNNPNHSKKANHNSKAILETNFKAGEFYYECDICGVDLVKEKRTDFVGVKRINWHHVHWYNRGRIRKKFGLPRRRDSTGESVFKVLVRKMFRK